MWCYFLAARVNIGWLVPAKQQCFGTILLTLALNLFRFHCGALDTLNLVYAS